MNQKNVSTGKKKYYFINEFFQVRIIVKACLLVIVGCIIFSVIIYSFSKQTTTTSFENSRLVLKSTADFIFPALVSSMIVVMTVLSIICLIVVLFASQETAVSMCMLEKSIRNVGEGDLTVTINSAPQEELEVLVQNYNQMVKELKISVLEIKKVNNELKENIEKLKEKCGSCSEEEIKLIEVLLKKQEKLNERLAYFRT